MFEFLIYMLIPTVTSAFLLYIFGIRRLKIGNKLKKMTPFIVVLTFVMYVAGDLGTCIMKPWVFDCSRTMGICPCGLPIEDFLFCFLIVFNITMATLTFSETQKRSKNRREFFEYFFLLRK